MADAIETLMGGFGKYHTIFFISISVCQYFVAFNQMAIIFLAPKVTYTCEGEQDKCPCENPVYDKSVFPNTMIMNWNLICKKKPLVSLHQSMFQLGTLTGSVVFGSASDRFGRKGPFIVSTMALCILTLAAPFVPSFMLLTVIRFFVGMTTGGAMVTSFVLMMELVGVKYREILSALYQVPFTMGHMILPVLGYFYRDYKEFLLSISIPSLLMLHYFVSISESPRWLLAMKRTDESIRIIEKIAKMNKRDTTNLKSSVIAFQAAMETNKLKKGTVMDLFRTPNIRKHILCMASIWVSCGYCYYGVSQYMGQLSGDIFMNVFISGTFTTCGGLIAIPLMKALGRRTIVICNLYLCALCLILLPFVPKGNITVILAAIGVVSVFIVFLVVYLYSAELFPTVVRNSAIGISSMAARIGSMLAPFVINLGETSEMLPPLVFAALPLLTGTVAFLLPETKGCPLLTTIEEGERFGKKQKQRNDG